MQEMLKSAREVTAKIKAGIPGRWAVGNGAYLQVAKIGKRATSSWLLRYEREARPCGSASVRTDWSRSPKRATRRGRCASSGSTASIRCSAKRAKREALRAKARAELSFRDAAERFYSRARSGLEERQAPQAVGSTRSPISTRSSGPGRSPASIRR